MMTIPPSAKVYLSLTCVDFRKQGKGLKKWIQIEMSMNPFSNAYFLFLSKNKKSMKILHFDGQGLGLYTKTLSEGRFKGRQGIHDASLSYVSIHPTEGQVMLMNGMTQSLKIPKNWQEIA